MVTPRLIKETGHRRKFLVIIDETPECERAVVYAAARAKATGGGLIFLYVVPPADFQHWLGVEEVMRQEAEDEGNAILSKYAVLAREKIGIEAETAIRTGADLEEIHNLIEEDQDIALIVLAASAANEGPGPLISAVVGRGAAFPIPCTVVPATLTDEDIASLS